MTDHDALLAAILAAPHEDTPRLVYADWLQEYHGKDGSERAWLIRTDVASHAAGGRSASWVGSESPTRRHYRPWMLRELDSLPFDGLCEWDAAYTRGFISELILPTDVFLQHAEAIFAAHPVEWVRLTDLEPDWDATTFPTWSWWHNEGPTAHGRPVRYEGDRESLPSELFELLPGSEVVIDMGEERKTYLSEAECWGALSAACVTFGRSLAGLPPLTAPLPAA